MRRSYPARYIVQCPNVKIPVEVLEQLAENSDEKTICYVVMHPSTPENVIEKLFLLYAKKSPQIIRAIASNPNTHSYILESIEECSSDRDTLIILAEHPNTPLSTLEKLVNHLHPWIRRAVAVRPDIPEIILLKIVIDAVNSLFPKFSPFDKKKLVHQGINDLRQAKNPSTPISLLEQFTKHQWNTVRLAVAKNPSSSNTILEKLARDQEFIISEWVAKHPNTSTKTLDILSICPASYVREIAIKHPNISRVTKQRYYSGIQYKR